MRARSALVLSRLKRREVLLDLLRLLDDAPAHVRVAAVNAIELMGESAAIDSLIKFYAKKGIHHTRPVLSALIRCSSMSPSLLQPYLKDGDVRMRRVVAAALAEVASADELESLLATASDPDPEVRAKLAKALGRTKDLGAVESLKTLARDPIWYVRMHAVTALASVSKPHSLATLWQTALDKHWLVRSKAAAALFELADDLPGLLKQMREGVRDRYARGALISLYERNGTTWNAISNLCSNDTALREKSRLLVRELLLAESFTSLLYALEAHPNVCVREKALRLIADCCPSSARSPLENLLTSPTLPQNIRQGVQALLAGLQERV